MDNYHRNNESSALRFPPIGNAEAVFRFALTALDQDSPEWALDWLRPAALRHQRDHRIWQVLALMLREVGLQKEAVDAFDTAACLAPRNFRVALGRAQTHFEAGLDAEPLYRSTMALAADVREAIPGLTAALCAAGRYDIALAEIEPRLSDDPTWLDGHWLSARVRWVTGNRQRIVDSVERALMIEPGHPGLLRLRTAILMASEQWDLALGSADRARRVLGNDASACFDKAVCLSESWRLADAEKLFHSLPPLDDPMTAVHLVRHILRMGRPELVESIVAPLLPVDNRKILQPYLSLAWRCLADDRWRSVDMPDATIGVYDLSFSPAELDAIADLLRTIHRSGFAPMEQSLRGGTQTEGMLLSRIDPEIIALRLTLARMVKRHSGLVSQRCANHPEFDHRFNKAPRFAGSWSVRLTNGGHHVSHTHPQGWLSSALYISLPPVMGEDCGGWLAFGAPPPNLGLNLPPVKMIEPKAGRLVLFPSTLWHGTVPISGGERLTIAFDVKRPA